jgi:ribosome-binding protein aMBF1 (putative translation factor)
MLDASFHDRRHADKLRDDEYRAHYERAVREIAQTDSVIRELDALRVDLGMSKAELARRANRNASSVRRLFMARQARPELGLIAALADALGADLRVMRRTP